MVIFKSEVNLHVPSLSLEFNYVYSNREFGIIIIIIKNFIFIIFFCWCAVFHFFPQFLVAEPAVLSSSYYLYGCLQQVIQVLSLLGWIVDSRNIKNYNIHKPNSKPQLSCVGVLYFSLSNPLIPLSSPPLSHIPREVYIPAIALSITTLLSPCVSFLCLWDPL